jgi:hypothetical protein
VREPGFTTHRVLPPHGKTVDAPYSRFGPRHQFTPTSPPAPAQNISSPLSLFSSLGRRPCVSWLVEAPGGQSDSARAHGPNRPDDGRRSDARTTCIRPFPEGQRFHSPGLPRQRLPGVPDHQQRRKPVGLRLTSPHHPPSPATLNVHPITPNAARRTSSRAGARVHHPPRPPATWENGGSTVLQVGRPRRARAPSPTQRRLVNRSRVAVGEGGGAGENAASVGTNLLVCPSAGPPATKHRPPGPPTSVAGAWTSVSARCALIREQPSFGPPTTSANHALKGLQKLAGGRAKRTPPEHSPPHAPAPRRGCQNAGLAPTTWAESDLTTTRRTSSRAGARVHHPPPPPAAWENGGSTVLQVWASPRAPAQNISSPLSLFSSLGRRPPGNSSIAPGCRARGYPGSPPQTVSEACRASLDRSPPHAPRLPHPTCIRQPASPNSVCQMPWRGLVLPTLAEAMLKWSGSRVGATASSPGGTGSPAAYCRLQGHKYQSAVAAAVTKPAHAIHAPISSKPRR